MVSVRRVAPILLILITLPMWGATKKKSSSHPPRDLHRVGDHWTAYNAPDPGTYPAGAKTYAIKRGDTLWGVAKQFVGNAYLWPQIWESNTWITDAHWIYPGDVLLIEGEVAQASSTATGTSSSDATSTVPMPTPQPGMVQATPTRRAADDIMGLVGLYTNAADPAGGSKSPIPLGSEADLYCYGYIGDPSEPMPNSVMAYEDYEMRYDRGAKVQDLGGSTGDLVFIDGGTATGINAGETYIAVQMGEMVQHPITKLLIGRQNEYRGQVRVLCADDHHARGIIVTSCHDIRPGARLKPMPQLPIPLARVPNMPGFCDPSSGKRAGAIVHAQDGWAEALGEGLLVEVDMGHDEQIQPGDFLTVYRENVQPGQARQVLGEIGILTTEAHTATGKIVAMRYSMRVGDRVEIR